MKQATDLKYLIDGQHFTVCPLLSTRRFVKYCQDRGVRTSKEQLERFEQLGLFIPLARVLSPRNLEEHPHIAVKVGREDGERVHLGRLEEGERWEGEVRRIQTSFDFGKPYADVWLEKGLAWDPSARPFRSWESYRDEGRMESYYSAFQCYHLYHLIEETTTISRAEIRASYGQEETERLARDMVERARKKISRCREEGVRGQSVAIICQVLSDRYFPQTQTDRRTIRISGFGVGRDPDWFEYCRDWDAEAALFDLGLDTDGLKGLQERIAFDANTTDPLKNWYGLVSFVSVEQKKRLKGTALFAQTLYSMEHMLRLFYEELMGERLPAPDESPMWTPDRLYGEGVPQNELEYLELLTNHYHLNPRPKLILAVEGDGESEQLPRLIEEFFGRSLPRLGVEVQNLHGIGDFTGRRFERFGALERFIDDHHNRQTFVYVVLDNEGGASDVRDRLTRKQSRYFPRRTVTTPDLIYLWGKNVEFDNFTHAEIAQAMTDISEGSYEFSPEQVAECENRFGGEEGDPLSRLYEKETEYGLNKRELLRTLFDVIISGGEAELDEGGEGTRPVTRMLSKVIELAATNYQPVTADIRRINQESGYLGDPLE